MTARTHHLYQPVPSEPRGSALTLSRQDCATHRSLQDFRPSGVDQVLRVHERGNQSSFFRPDPLDAKGWSPAVPASQSPRAPGRANRVPDPIKDPLRRKEKANRCDALLQTAAVLSFSTALVHWLRHLTSSLRDDAVFPLLNSDDRAAPTSGSEKSGRRWRPREDVSWGRNPAASVLRGPPAGLGGAHRGAGCVPQPRGVVEACRRRAQPEEKEGFRSGGVGGVEAAARKWSPRSQTEGRSRTVSSAAAGLACGTPGSCERRLFSCFLVQLETSARHAGPCLSCEWRKGGRRGRYSGRSGRCRW